MSWWKLGVTYMEMFPWCWENLPLRYFSHVMRKPVLPYANNKGADQPAHPRSLISAFVVRFLDSIIPLVSISEISSLFLASVAVQASLSLPWSQTPKTGFLVTMLISNYKTDQTDKTVKFNFTICNHPTIWKDKIWEAQCFLLEIIHHKFQTSSPKGNDRSPESKVKKDRIKNNREKVETSFSPL